MLKCRITKKRFMAGVKVKANGTPHELAFDCSVLIQEIYGWLNERSGLAADEFKNTLIRNLIIPKSPVWDRGITKPNTPSGTGV